VPPVAGKLIEGDTCGGELKYSGSFGILAVLTKNKGFSDCSGRGQKRTTKTNRNESSYYAICLLLLQRKKERRGDGFAWGSSSSARIQCGYRRKKKRQKRKRPAEITYPIVYWSESVKGKKALAEQERSAKRGHPASTRGEQGKLNTGVGLDDSLKEVAGRIIRHEPGALLRGGRINRIKPERANGTHVETKHKLKMGGEGGDIGEGSVPGSP